ncbi:MAG TPA: M16 family metallopeptidase, partial [Xylella taiwanensis]
PKPRLFLIHRPEAEQSLILTGLVAPSTKDPANLEINVANGAFGGIFSSRLNMNLREDKRWAYGASSVLINAQGQRPYLFLAPVQTDKTAESIAEIQKEAQAVIGSRPLTQAEVDKIKHQLIRGLPGSYETTDAVLDAIEGIVQYERPDNYVQTLKPHLEAIDQASAERAIKRIVDPNAMTWVIIGDLSKIEAPVRALHLGDVRILDSDGHPATPH